MEMKDDIDYSPRVCYKRTSILYQSFDESIGYKQKYSLQQTY